MSKEKPRVNPRKGGSFVRQGTGKLEQMAGTKTPTAQTAKAAEREEAPAPPSEPETTAPSAKGTGAAKDSGK